MHTSIEVDRAPLCLVQPVFDRMEELQPHVLEETELHTETEDRLEGRHGRVASPTKAATR